MDKTDLNIYIFEEIYSLVKNKTRHFLNNEEYDNTPSITIIKQIADLCKNYIDTYQ